ncbi:MAG: ComEC/Rec2 family competence protein, partial [Patescibacteria group bacterium]
ISKFLGILLLLGLIVFSVNSYQANTVGGDLRLIILDIGQGDAILIDTPERQQILTDGGRGTAILSELAKVLPLSDKDLDLVISTHNDADHLGGLNEVLKHYQVDEVWLTGAVGTTKTYQAFLQLIADNHIPVKKVMAGQTVKFGDLEGIVLSPLRSYDGATPSSQNATSIVTYWQYGEQSFLLTGDAELAQEQELISRGLLRRVDILKVSHHGSHTASGESFLKAIAPKIAVISVGASNQYGHPHQEVINRLAKLKIPALRTDQSGRITFSVSLTDYSYTTLR